MTSTACTRLVSAPGRMVQPPTRSAPERMTHPVPRGGAARAGAARSREAIRDELPDARLALVRGGGDQLVHVLSAEIGRQHHHPAEVEAAFGQRLEQNRELPGGPGCTDPLARLVLRESEIADAIGVHGRIPRRQVQPPLVELGEVGEKLGGGGALATNQRGQVTNEGGVREVRERVGVHGDAPRGRNAGGASSLSRLSRTLWGARAPQRGRRNHFSCGREP